MTFYGYHGVRPEERTLGQRFVVDVAIYRDVSAAAASDNLTDATDYSRIYREVRAVIEGEPHNLLESLAAAVADRLHQGFDGIAWVRVTKPGAPVPGATGTFAVEVWRPRGNPPSAGLTRP
jgi:dihydroneopterin aldolase